MPNIICSIADFDRHIQYTRIDQRLFKHIPLKGVSAEKGGG